MELTTNKRGATLEVKPSGRIDTNTAGDFGSQVYDELDNINELILNFSDVTYISSVGLRVILEFQKRMNQQGRMKMKNVQPAVLEVFEMTGFTNILTIE